MNFTDKTIVCYCSQISVKEIKDSVANGCKTIAEVRDFLGKHITGNCSVSSPYKKCCHKFFNEVIESFSK
ncbi:(2Fe-2S)-binding protein [Bacteroidales bacterium OttesenSCG-928-M11]|jgi:bacterioferritin-associated ferredoxin|nr:(2Fe-2S)-binding protein [Bacteroidales bacterium OttesenSCG-928-M11]